MIKIRQKFKTDINLIVPYDPAIKHKVKDDIETICNHITEVQLNSIAKLFKNETMRKLALNALLKFVS